jgi:hypothetical protein
MPLTGGSVTGARDVKLWPANRYQRRASFTNNECDYAVARSRTLDLSREPTLDLHLECNIYLFI